MSSDPRCTQPERWTTIPDFEAADEEILRYLEHVESCPFHSRLENSEMHIVQQDFQTARLVAPQRELPLSSSDKDEMLDEFERYLNTREGIPQIDHSGAEISSPSVRISKPRKSWFVSIKRPAFVLTVVAIGAVIIVGLWRLAHRTPMVVLPPEHAKLEPNGEASSTPDTHVPPSSNATLHDAGVIIQLDGEGTLQGLPFSLSPTNAEAVRKALKDQIISVGPLPQALVAKTEARMGTDETLTFILIKPTQKIVLTPTPTFVWSALSGAKTYLVSIYDEQDNLVLSSKPLYVTTWKPEIPLPRGKIYSWEVTANKDGKEITSSVSATKLHGKPLEAKFKVLEQSKADEITEAKRRYPDFHLLLGIVQARAGLMDEAEVEFKKLLSANPKSVLAQNLLRKVQVSRASTRRQ